MAIILRYGIQPVLESDSNFSREVEFASSLGAVRLSLSTEISNEAAQALYRSTNWTRDEQFFVYHFAVMA
ncbi:MAG: hypothetical protein ACU836_16465 [Gammaproteobacteria bacterium]